MTSLIAFVGICTILGLIFTPWFVNVVLAPGFDQATSQLTISLTRITLFEVLIIAISSVCTALLNSRNRFLLPTLGIAIHNVTMISGILLGSAVPAIGIYGPAVGTIFDALLQLVIMIPGLRRLNWRFKVAWDPRDSDLREVVRLLIPNGLSGLVNYAGGIVDTRYGSLINNASGLPALNNALLLIGLPIRLLGMAIAQATFPRLAAHVAEENWPGLRSLMKRALLISIGLGLLALVGLVLVGHPLIKLLFERGRFDAEASALTYHLLVMYAIGLPAYIGTEIITRCLIALHDTRTPLLTNCLQLAGRIALIPLWDQSLGIASIALAFAVTSIGETLLLGSVLWLKLRKRH